MPNRSLVLKDYRRWRRKVLKCTAAYFDRSVLDWIKSNPPRYFVDDKLDWLEEAVYAVKQRCVNSKAELADALSAEFDFILGFHGCRIESKDSYQQLGIRPSDPDQLQAQALRLFGDSGRIREVFAELNRSDDDYESHNRGKTFFCWHQEDFIDDGCGHYLLYGSEYLLCVANRIRKAHVLRATGKATIIECDVPVSYIPRDYLEEICGYLLCEIAERYVTRRSGFDGGCFHITRDLEPRHIVAFHHPKGIRNPHNFNSRED